MIRAVLLVLVIAASAVFGPGPAQAQTAGAVAYSGLAAINKIILGTPGVTAVVTGGSASVSASAAEAVTIASRGLSVPVMVNASSAVTAARLAGLLGTAMKVGTVIGAATIILPWIAQQTGIHVCPPAQGFFCKPDPDQGVYGKYWLQGYYGMPRPTLIESCLAVRPAWDSTVTGPYTVVINGEVGNCYGYRGATQVSIGGVYQRGVCPNANSLSGCGTVPPVKPDVPATATDISTPLAPQLSDQAKMQSAMDTARLSNVALFDASSPVTVTAPSVTTQPQSNSTTVNNPDGTTSTKVVSSTTTINPTITGTTIGDTKITYPATTTVTTTTTNNTTNVSTTETTIINENGVPQTADKIDLPTDYAREATQRQIEQDLNTDAAAKLPDQGPVVTSAQTDSDTKMGKMRDDATNGMPADQNRFWNFLFSPPTGTCSPYVLTVNGHDTGKVDICDWVERLRGLLAWLMALGTAFAVFKNMVGGVDD